MTSLVVLVLSGILIAYTYIGYPLLLRLSVRLRGARYEPPALLMDEQCPSVAILICAHNESDRIGKKIENCLSQDYPGEKLRIVIVSDGCTDSTNDQVLAYSNKNVTLVENPARSGKATCLNLGMEKIDEDVVILADVRQRLSRDAARRLVSHFEHPDIAAVSGELRFETSTSGDDDVEQDVSTYWRYEVALRRAEAAANSVIGVTGALYALRRSAFSPIPDGTILDDVLIPMNAVLSGHKVKFDSEAVAYDQPSTHPGVERNRKVRTLAGNFQLLALRPQLLSPRRNPAFWLFLSHKVLRLLVPLAMLAAFVSNAFLATTNAFFLATFVAQIIAYAVAALPETYFNIVSNAPFRLIRTFVHMHWYVVLGLKEFIVNRKAHLWNVSTV